MRPVQRGLRNETPAAGPYRWGESSRGGKKGGPNGA